MLLRYSDAAVKQQSTEQEGTEQGTGGDVVILKFYFYALLISLEST